MLMGQKYKRLFLITLTFKKYKMSLSLARHDEKNSGFGMREINLSLGVPLNLAMCLCSAKFPSPLKLGNKVHKKRTVMKMKCDKVHKGLNSKG